MSLSASSPALALVSIATLLRGRRSGQGYLCHCPVHSDQHSSLSVWIDREGRLAAHCFAGCSHADLVAYFSRRGLWPGDAVMPSGDLARHRAGIEAYAEEQRRLAAVLWRESVPLPLTPGWHYLAHWRGIALDPERLERLRWHWQRHALVALITASPSDVFRGVQLSFIDRNTNRKCSARDNPRLTIGQAGIVRLLDGGPGAPLLLGEGLETSLSGALLLADGSPVSAWATLGAGELERVRPPPASEVTLLVDRDASGRGEWACRRAAERLSGLGRSVRLAFPPSGCGDFNDYHRRRP